MPHPDLPAEQSHVDRAYERLEAMRGTAQAMLREAFGERGGTLQSLAERDIRVRNGLSRLEQLQIGGEALVFGRIDRESPAEDAVSPESYHIGRLAISDTDQEPLVVDWRAPVAEPFYRATGAHPMGLRRRRHFMIHGRRITDLEDEFFDTPSSGQAGNLGLSGPQVLMAALEQSRTGRMRDIVATVQREQDEIIRAPLPGVLVVQGGPGTGKTAVALHRAAYLLYTHRFPLETQGVLVAGPNPLFLRYIERVLPSLGETGVELSTVPGLFAGSTATAHEGVHTARLKGDIRMAAFVARAVSDRQRPLRRTVVVPYGRFALRISPSMSARIVNTAKRRAGTHNSRRRLVENLLWRHLLEELERLSQRPGAAPVEAGTYTPSDLGRDLRSVAEVAGALDRMWPVLRPQELLHDLFGARPLIDLAGRGLFDASERSALFRERSETYREVPWTAADIPLLDEAAALLGSPRRRPDPQGEMRSYGHIVVDEAQDLSPMELRMLARRSLSGSMTVVGDIAQGTSDWAPASWSEVIRHLPARRGWRQAELTLNYRTPAEVMTVAAPLLRFAAPGISAPEAVRSGSEQPRFVAAGAHVARSLTAIVGEELLAVSSESAESGIIAVIAAPSQVGDAARWIADAGFPVGRASGSALDSTVSVLSADEAKGLEFDAVIVLEPAAIVRESPRGERALYVAMTRTIRRLAVLHAEALPDALRADRQPAVSGERRAGGR